MGYNDVMKLARVDFQQQGYVHGKTSLLVSDDNVKNWGIFATQKDIDMMIPSERSLKRKKSRSLRKSNPFPIIKEATKQEIIDNIIQVDEVMNIHIPWLLLPKRKQPAAYQKPAIKRAVPPYKTKNTTRRKMNKKKKGDTYAQS